MAAAHISKARFLDADLQVIRGKGYEAITVDDLCEAAQLTKGSFFHHFPGKEQLAPEAAQHFAEMASGLFEASTYRRLGAAQRSLPSASGICVGISNCCSKKPNTKE